MTITYFYIDYKGHIMLNFLCLYTKRKISKIPVWIISLLSSKFDLCLLIHIIIFLMIYQHILGVLQLVLAKYITTGIYSCKISTELKRANSTTALYDGNSISL